MPGTLGDLRPEGRRELRLPQAGGVAPTAVSLARPLGALGVEERHQRRGGDIYLAESIPVGCATATMTPASPPSRAFLGR